MASSGLKADELMEVVKEVSPTTVAAPPVPQGAPKMPPAPQTHADSLYNFSDKSFLRKRFRIRTAPVTQTLLYSSNPCSYKNIFI